MTPERLIKIVPSEDDEEEDDDEEEQVDAELTHIEFLLIIHSFIDGLVWKCRICGYTNDLNYNECSICVKAEHVDDPYEDDVDMIDPSIP